MAIPDNITERQFLSFIDGGSGTAAVQTKVVAGGAGTPPANLGDRWRLAFVDAGLGDGSTALQVTQLSGGATGTVTSVAQTVPAGFAVAGSPITTAGTLAISYATGQTANRFLATPDGSTGALALRAIVAGDLPVINLASSAAGGVTGNLPVTNLNSGTSASSTTFWRGDGTWAIAGTGTVTSVAASVPAGFTIAGSPITTSGTLAISYATGQTANSFLATPDGSTGALALRAIVVGDLPTITVAKGGTGLTSGTSGGILGYTASGTLASSVLLTTNAIILGAGAGATPTPMGSLGTTTTVLHGAAAGPPTFGAVNLAADVTGNLPVANLGSGTSASSTTFWRGDATWATPAGSATIDNTINGFRLTLTTGVPVTTADVTGATTLFCAPYTGNRIALFDGSNWNIRTSAEFSLALGTLTSGKPYDVFCFDNSGTPTLEFLVWTNSTTRATALALQDGVLSKTGALTRRYLGTFFTTATTTTEDSLANRYLYNFYNPVMKIGNLFDATSHTLNSAGREWNNGTALRINFVLGQAQFIRAMVGAQIATSSVNATELFAALDSGTAQLNTNANNIGILVPASATLPILSYQYADAGVVAAGAHFLTVEEIHNNATTSTLNFGSNYIEVFV